MRSARRGGAQQENKKLWTEDEQEGEEEATAEEQKEGHEQLQRDNDATKWKGKGERKRKRADRRRDDEAREKVHGEVEAVGCYSCHE